MSRPHRVRILFVVGNFVAGGAERHLLEMWSRLDRDGFDVGIVTFRREGQFLADVERLGWPVFDLGMGRRIYDLRGVRGFFRLLATVRRFRPDVIHGYLFGPNLFAALAGRLLGIRAVVVAKRNIDAFETKRQIAVQRFALGLATHVTSVSEAVAETVVHLGVPRDRITVIPNGVDAGRFGGGPPDRSLLGATDPRPIIGSVGCLAPRKDYGTLLDALALVAGRGHEFQVALVGDGPDRAMLEKKAHALGLDDRVRFLGERPDVERLLPAMDVFVLSSREEGIPNALLEAMAAGRPSIVTAVGGNREVLEDGATGWMVPPHSPEAFASALEQALSQPGEARRRGEAARRVTIQERGIDAMVRRHEAFYRRVAGRPEPAVIATASTTEPVSTGGVVTDSAPPSAAGAR